ncbi:MAG: hypothetical protein KKH94_08910 [Candidatus Omnitrophica bacterium]|nr:hypothetical protein [Candidatus Omnitrophota bacterium]
MNRVTFFRRLGLILKIAGILVFVIAGCKACYTTTHRDSTLIATPHVKTSVDNNSFSQ